MNNLSSFALACSCAGLLFLFLVSVKTSVNDASLRSLEKGRIISVEGEVEAVKTYATFTIIEISEQKTVPVLIFDTSTTIQKGDYITVIGKTNEYDDSVQIIAEKVKIKQ